MKRFTCWMRTLAIVGALLVSGQALAQEDSDADLLKELEALEADEEKPKTKKETGIDEALENVVVTATKKQQTIAAAPAIISVIPASRIKAMGYRTVGEALQSLPGVYLITDHVNWNAGVRGVNGGQRAASRIVKLMIDGQPVGYRPTHENWLGEELLPLDAVLRIEVIRGPASALYGANAFFGVVNIITKTGAMVDGANAIGNVGAIESHLSAGGSLVVGKKEGNLDILVAGTGSFADRSGMEITPIGSKAENRWAAPNNVNRDDTSVPASLFGKIAYQSEALGRVTLDMSYQRLHSRGEFLDWGTLTRSKLVGPSPGIPAYEDPRYDYVMNQISLQNLYIRGRLTRTFLENFSFTLSTAFANMGPTDADHLVTSESGTGVGDYYARDVGTTSMDFQGELTYNFKDVNSITLGTDYTLDWHELQTIWSHSLQNSSNAHVVTPTRNDILDDRRFSNLGVYLQGIVHPFQVAGIDLLDKLALTLGFRYDRQNIYGDDFNYRVGAVYLWRKLSVKALFGTSYKAPASVQLFTGRLRVGGGLIANPKLDVEKAKTIELQAGGEFIRGLNATVTWFYNIMDDKVEIIEDPAVPSAVSAQNVAAVRGTGVEADVGYRWQGLTAYFNFAFEKSTVESRTIDKRDTDLYPGIMLKFGAMYKEPKFHLGASLEGKYIGSVFASQPNAEISDPVDLKPYKIDGYFTMDLAIHTVDIKLIPDRETFLRFKIGNLTGASYVYPGFRDYDIPALGRTFMFTLNQQI